MASDQRNNLSCSEAGDLIAAGQQLIIAGARLKDGLMIKAALIIFSKPAGQCQPSLV